MEPEIGSVPTGFFVKFPHPAKFCQELASNLPHSEFKGRGWGGGGVGGKSEGGTEVRDTLNFTSFKVGS